MHLPLALLAAVLLLVGAGGATAHTGIVLGGTGTAEIDGVFAPGEWANAAVLPFTAGLPSGGSVSASLRVLNDGTNLYFGVAVASASIRGTVAFVFDNDHDGSAGTEQGDDGLAFGATTSGLNDNVRSFLPPCPAQFLCAFRDTDAGGTTDGIAATSVVGGATHYEVSHPLDSADDGNDFSVQPGDVLGFRFQLSICDPDPPACVFNQPVIDGDIVLRVPDTTPPTLSVRADPAVLWPPNGKLRDVTISIDAADESGAPTVELISIESDEPAAGDIQVVDLRHVRLRAERSRRGDGRTYALTYLATDRAGNTTVATATVVVPRDRSGHLRSAPF